MKDCNQVITIPQDGPTCWFNALLMGFFYSQGMRRALFSCVDKWKSDNKDASRLYKMFLDILVHSYIKKSHIDKLSPEKILKAFYDMDPVMFPHNPDVHVGGVANTYTSSLFKFFHLYDDVMCVHFQYLHATKAFATRAPIFGPNTSTRPKVIVLELNTSLIERTFLDWHLKDLMYDELTPDHIKYVLRQDLIETSDYIDPVEGIITFNTEKYIIDSVYISNFNRDSCSIGHAIAGVTCNKRRFVYNGWTRYTMDPGFKNDAYSLNPCELMAYDWLSDENSYCINTQMCKMDRVMDDGPGSVCFNFHKGYRVYYAVREDLTIKKIRKVNDKLVCPREYYNFSR
jgi:hypothetical protein